MKLPPSERPRLKAQFLTWGPDTRLEDEHKDTHRVLAPFGFYSAILGREVWVPADFITDFSSVPRVVGLYLLFGGKGKRASLIHDYLYTCGVYSRFLCDEVFREALQVSGYSAFTIGAMYGAVRVGGASHYEAPSVPQEPHVDEAIREAA